MRINVQPSQKQVEGASFLITRPKGGFVCYATGSGKSLLQILALFKQVLDKKVEKTLCICTKSSLVEVLGDFEARTDVQPYVVSSLADLEYFMRSSTQQFGLVQYNRLAAMVSQGVIVSEGSEDEEKTKKVATPIDQVKMTYLWNLFASRKIAVTLDECHSIKTPGSFITRVLRRLRSSWTYCFGATATAVMADVYDLYHIVDFFHPGHFGPLEEFNEQYLVRRTKHIYMGGGRKMTIYEVVSYKNMEQLQKKVAEVCHSYFPKYDVVFDECRGEMLAQAEYTKAAQGLFEKGEGDTDWSEKKHAQRLVDLQYVVNRDPGKKKLLEDLLARMIDKGVLIFCSYYESVTIVENILKERNIPFKEISGRIDDRKTVRDWFMRSPQGKALIITRAGGQSLNLQGTPNMILFDIPFGIGYMLQIMGRVCREYSDFKQFRIAIPILNGTIDDYKYNLISSNREILMRLFRNELVPPSEQVTSFNQEIIDQLKKQFLWRTAPVQKAS